MFLRNIALFCLPLPGCFRIENPTYLNNSKNRIIGNTYVACLNKELPLDRQECLHPLTKHLASLAMPDQKEPLQKTLCWKTNYNQSAGGFVRGFKAIWVRPDLWKFYNAFLWIKGKETFWKLLVLPSRFF